MPSSRSHSLGACANPTTPPRATGLARHAALALIAASACGSDTDPRCDSSFLRYDNFGAPFVSNWCRACHSAALPPDMRQGAPDTIDLDTLGQIRAWSHRIALSAGTDAGDRAMPPAGGPSAAERAMLVEWLSCGAP